ncbi:hypothetical protein [Alteromonas halophila]|uniref:Uncharacterized protein n=1 Tax=Alteromonas halophila TaxID=516698 RepID=A0A918JI02_9ALTE|nr:hypothetical protein [Alteromonas halophila]GGW81666.1 hypothetical protein GCM10007391_13610 [Alteromonas halophila]
MDVDSIFKKYQANDHAVDKAIDHGVVGTFNQVDDANATLVTGPLGPVICRRLYLLQYLSSHDFTTYQSLSRAGFSNPRALSDWLVQFNHSVKLLQQEAGLQTDQWIGSKTFKAMQQLFSFEEPTNLSLWYKHGRSSTFLKRAIYVRMQFTGLIPGNHVRFFEQGRTYQQGKYELGDTLQDGFILWRKVLQTWGMPPAAGTTNQYLTATLFDIDGLTRTLNARRSQIASTLQHTRLDPRWESYTALPTGALTRQQIKQLALRVLVAHSRIEVWLQGYASALDNDPSDGMYDPGDSIDAHDFSLAFNEPLRRRRNHNSRHIIGPELSLYRQFWQDTKKLSTTLKEQNVKTGFKVTITNPLLTSIKHNIRMGRLTMASMALQNIHCAAIIDQVPMPDKTTHIRRINEEYTRLSTRDRNVGAWQKGRGLVEMVLDGVKRLAKWFWQSVKNVFRKVSHFVQRIIRAVQQLAVKGLTYYFRITELFSTSVHWVMQPVMYQSDAITVFRDRDYDVSVFIDDGPHTLSAINGMQKDLYLSVARFRTACNLLTVLLDVFVGVAALVGGVRKWKIVDAALALANFYERLPGEDKRYLDLAFRDPDADLA